MIICQEKTDFVVLGSVTLYRGEISVSLLGRVRFPRRKYKDRLFQRVFEEKRDLLELYNAINGTAYDNLDELEITTLEGEL